MEYLLKHKRLYLMVAGTLLPGFILKKAGDLLNLSEETQNIFFITGCIAGGVLTNKMLKK
jgi:hypothetical protein